MSITLGLSQLQTLKAIKDFLLATLPLEAVFYGQENRVSPGQVKNYGVLTPIMRERLATNIVTLTDNYILGIDRPVNTSSDMQETRLTVQLDVFGPASADNAQILTTLFRGAYAADVFEALKLDITPLYTSEPRQLPYVDDSRQVQQRWSIDLVLEIKPVVTITGQDFAGELGVDLISVDERWNPLNEQAPAKVKPTKVK